MRTQMATGSLMLVLLGGCAADQSADWPLAASSSLSGQTGSVPATRPATTPPVVQETAAPVLRGLTLEQALARAAEHPELAEARAQVEAASGRIQQAGLFPNPELIGRMESAPFSGKTAGDAEYLAGVSQSVPLGNRLGAAKQVERLDQQRLGRLMEARVLQVRKAIRNAFATALYAGRVVETQADTAKAAEEGAAIAKARVAAGDATSEEQARAEMELARLRLELSRSRSLHRQALTNLAAAMGHPAIAIESVQGDMDATLEVPTLEELSNRLAQSPFMTALAAEVATERARVDLAKAQRIPDVNLELLYRRIGQTDTDAFDAGFRIALPVFDRNQGRIREARAGVMAAQARAQSAANTLQAQLRTAHAQLAQALASAKVLREEIIPRADRVLAAAQARYRGGDTSLADVLQVQRDRAAVRLSYLEALREVMTAWAELAPLVQNREDRP